MILPVYELTHVFKALYIFFFKNVPNYQFPFRGPLFLFPSHGSDREGNMK